MIELVIAACLATGECKEARLTYDAQDVSLMTCMITGQVEVARWQERHPVWQIKRWHCDVTGQDDRAASRSVSGQQDSEVLLVQTAAGARGSSVAAVHNAESLPVWKTIILGTYRTPDDLRDALRRKRIWIGHAANPLLDLSSPALQQVEAPIDLAVISVAELGFAEDGASLSDVIFRAKRLGLTPCLPEVAFQLPLQYQHWPLGEFLLIATEPIAPPAGEPVALLVGNGGAGLVIVGRRADYDDLIAPETKLVFAAPR
ncbi:hypothetical protein [Dongia deserti]|uniref:hypothetical protein n=1 Tax=Dongia deserti TaxID=2268030 RepID=UPI000E65DBD7|nr:hypothetical protein [Dongia deserti]